jgi:hypothetical protein
MTPAPSRRPPLSPSEAWLSDGRHVLRFRPTRWEREVHQLEITTCELLPDQVVPTRNLSEADSGSKARRKEDQSSRARPVAQSSGAVRNPRRGLTGAGLDPSCTPAGIPSNGSDGEGCWGEETAGANADVGVGVVRVIAVPVGGATVVGIVDPGTTAQQLNDPPTGTVAPAKGDGNESIRGASRRHTATAQQPQTQQPRVKNSPRAKGSRD